MRKDTETEVGRIARSSLFDRLSLCLDKSKEMQQRDRNLESMEHMTSFRIR